MFVVQVKERGEFEGDEANSTNFERTKVHVFDGLAAHSPKAARGRLALGASSN